MSESCSQCGQPVIVKGMCKRHYAQKYEREHRARRSEQRRQSYIRNQPRRWDHLFELARDQFIADIGYSITLATDAGKILDPHQRPKF